MQTVILLTLVILTGFVISKNKSPYDRVVIGSVFGSVYFSSWPFIVYTLEIHNEESKAILPAYILISVFAVLFSWFLIRRRHKLAVAVISFIFFISLMIFSMSYEAEIKNTIAINTAYFNQTQPTIKNIKQDNHELRKNMMVHNYVLTLNESWQLKNDKGPLFIYFDLMHENHKIAELRPKCFSPDKIPFTDIVKNIIYLNHTTKFNNEKVCYKINNTNYACKIEARNKANQVKRIRWLDINTKNNAGIELDFILIDKPTFVLNEIDKIIRSTKLSEKKNEESDCIGLAEWM